MPLSLAAVAGERIPDPGMYVCTYVCMYVCLYIYCMYMYVHVYIGGKYSQPLVPGVSFCSPLPPAASERGDVSTP